jgi:hypothetical protein
MLLCATLIAAAIATAALAMADYWYTVCRYPDNTWQICNFRGDAQCTQRRTINELRNVDPAATLTAYARP